MSRFKRLPRTVVVSTVACCMSLLLLLAGCGSTNKAATNSTSSTATTPTTATSYHISLTHVTGSSGGANAAGVAILTVRAPSHTLCWNIAPVKDFPVSTSKTQATIVTIQPTPSGTPSTPGIPLGMASYSAAGCSHLPSAVLGRLSAHPQMFYLSIYNTQSGDAVRGQV